MSRSVSFRAEENYTAVVRG